MVPSKIYMAHYNITYSLKAFHTHLTNLLISGGNVNKLLSAKSKLTKQERLNKLMGNIWMLFDRKLKTCTLAKAFKDWLGNINSST